MGQNFAFPSHTRSNFEFEDDNIGNRDSTNPSHLEEGTSGAQSMSPMVEALQSVVGIVPVADGLSTVRHSRRYSMRNRHSRVRLVRGMGVHIQDRVKLDSVLIAKARGGCLQNCLREVDKRYILD